MNYSALLITRHTEKEAKEKRTKKWKNFLLKLILDFFFVLADYNKQILYKPEMKATTTKLFKKLIKIHLN